MSLFNDPIYNYWHSHIEFIWSIKSIAIGDGLLSILDPRALKLLYALRQIASQPNVQIEMDSFAYVAMDYDDLSVLAYLMSDRLKLNVRVANRNILYLS